MKKYIISIIKDDTKQKMFLGKDISSGGYYYWTTIVNNAVMLNDIDEVDNILKSSKFTVYYKMSDGSTCPPRMIHSGLGLCNKLLENTGRIEILEIAFSCIKTKILKEKIIPLT